MFNWATLKMTDLQKRPYVPVKQLNTEYPVSKIYLAVNA